MWTASTQILDIISFDMHCGAPVGIRHFLAIFIRAFYITKDMDKLTRQLNAGLEAIGTDGSGLEWLEKPGLCV